MGIAIGVFVKEVRLVVTMILEPTEGSATLAEKGAMVSLCPIP